MGTQNRITVAYGDGIGPEIMDATIRIMDAANVGLEYDVIEIGEKVYKSGHKSGISPESWETLRQNKVLLKAPITTPQGGGYKSLNVTIRKSLGLFANVRPFRAYPPFVPSHFPHMDVVIVRENEEDLYAGIEHQQTSEVVQTLKLISEPGSEKIIRYAFEYAKAYGRKKVTCMTKDNIMKHTDGMFEAIHGSAPDIAGQDMANPSGLLNGAFMMLVQLGKADKAELIQNAWLKTLEDGIHTGDVYRLNRSVKKVGTKEFADAVIERLGQVPEKLKAVKYNPNVKIEVVVPEKPAKKKELVGVDVFIDWRGESRDANEIGDRLLKNVSTDKLKLDQVSNRGVVVYPNGMDEIFKSDHWRCRFTHPEGATLDNADIIEILKRVQKEGFDFIKTEHLYHFDGERGYSLSQGE